MGSSLKMSLILFFGCSLFLQGTLGHEFETCESLSKDNCAFAVDSQGKRCILEKGDEDNTFRCVETEVQAKDLAGYIETDSCIEVCATDREVLGWPKAIPIDRVCATECRDACKNVFDFYSHVATSGGKTLESLCEHANIKTDESDSNSDSDSETDHHRSMSEVDSGAPASAPSTGGARPVSEIAASLWGAATSFLDSPAAKSPAAAEAMDSAIDAAAKSPTASEAVENAVNAAASSPAAAGYEDDYSGSP